MPTRSRPEKSLSHFFEDGNAAYLLENFEVAEKLFAQVPNTDPNYPESLFLRGLCLLGREEYNQAYLMFHKAKDAGFTKDKHLDDYISSAALLNKPAVWYHTESRRKAWWDNLSESDLEGIILLMNDLKINGKSYDKTYIYHDDDIAKLFKITILPLKHRKLHNLQMYRYFTDVDVIILENTKLNSDQGIEYLFKLKIVRTDHDINLPQITFLSSTRKITIIHTNQK